jgi:hypothetical protein
MRALSMSCLPVGDRGHDYNIRTGWHTRFGAVTVSFRRQPLQPGLPRVTLTWGSGGHDPFDTDADVLEFASQMQRVWAIAHAIVAHHQAHDTPYR